MHSSAPDAREHMRAVIKAAGGAGTATGWSELWQKNLTMWDLAKATPALGDEVDAALTSGRLDRSSAVLVPGCGAAYDVRALADKGFARVVGADITEEAIARARDVVAGAPGAELLCGDFFADARLAPGSFSFIFDYTFFCAIPPSLRGAWGARTAALLAPGGRLLTFAFPFAPDAAATDPAAAGPPFPVSIEEYTRALEPHGVRIEDGPRVSAHAVRENEKVVWWVKSG